MTTGGGGWTLIAVSSDDGQATWTWNNRSLMGQSTQGVGSLDERHKDFKSLAYNRIPFESVLFVHSTPADPEHTIWAQYDPGDGVQTFGAFIASHGENVNYATNPGIPMSAGTLVDPDPGSDGSGMGVKELCSTDLYINPCGLDGQNSCSGSKNAYGPTWSHSNGEGCPLDDPGLSGSLGPCSGSAGNSEYSNSNVNVQPGVGFGVVLGLNTGQVGSATNFMSIYVRVSP